MMNIRIYPQFIGRLGNNLFQIAACIGYAKKHGVGWGIKKGYVERGFNVMQVDRFFPHLPSVGGIHFRKYEEPSYDYREIPFHPDGVRLMGFWQSLKYFEDAQDEVRQALKIKYVDGYEDYVSIHVRRGDYVNLGDNFPPVTYEYVNDACDALYDRVGYKRVIIFSDDIPWCKTRFSNWDGAEFSEGRNEYEDLCLMASCGHHIIANSSFSWWGGFLGRNPDKIVVSPHHTSWYGPANGVVKDAQRRGVEPCIDLIPDSWVKIKFR